MTENPSSLFHWGVKFERNNYALNPNSSSEKNGLISSLSRFMGIMKLDALVTGSGADNLNNNKFTLARVALSATSRSNLTGSVEQHMREAAYIRNGKVNPSSYTISDDFLGNRYTMATLLKELTPSEFNKFSPYTKFVTFMHGGWDGVNILDRNARRLNDKAASFDSGASTSFSSPGFTTNFAGAGSANSTVMSYKTAVDLMTDPLSVNVNVIAIPGIREPYLTD